tara:strand:+ start:4131 stop:4289 length:159 start_codon:yes stop_codon:yes gene_type:complete
MGQVKGIIEDFLHVVNNEQRDKYRDKKWDWNNLPHFEKMLEVMRESKTQGEK